MQDRYVGDIGDFGKYGLLRSLSDGLSLGIVWYLTPDEGHNSDGKHIRYLESTPANADRYRTCDPDLYDILARLVADDVRSVRAVRERGVFSRGTTYYENLLTFNGMPGIGVRATTSRLEHRRHWVETALQTTETCDLVFADPDNGIECGRQRHERHGPKHVYVDELAPFVVRGQSLVVYHHLDRSGPAHRQITRALERLERGTDSPTRPFALYFRRGTARAFLVVPSLAHEASLTERARRFAAGPWSQHFELISLEPSPSLAIQ